MEGVNHEHLNELLRKYNLPEKPTDIQIREVYRKRSLDCHPDRPMGSNENFLELKNDYDEIHELTKRLSKLNYNITEDNDLFSSFQPFADFYQDLKNAIDQAVHIY